MVIMEQKLVIMSNYPFLIMFASKQSPFFIGVQICFYQGKNKHLNCFIYHGNIYFVKMDLSSFAFGRDAANGRDI